MIETIEDYEKVVKKCFKCPLSNGRINVVPGNGNVNANIMLIGQAPGYNEDKTGKEFVGKSGELLNLAIDIVGLNKEDMYFTSVVKCRPQNNKEPENAEIESCLNYLRFQVMKIKPKIIVLLGRVAYNSIFKSEKPFKDVRGEILTKKDIKYLVTYHPSAVLRDESKKNIFLEDLAKVKKCYDKIKL